MSKYNKVDDLIDELNKYLDDTPLDFNYAFDRGILEGVSVAFRVLDKLTIRSNGSDDSNN